MNLTCRNCRKNTTNRLANENCGTCNFAKKNEIKTLVSTVEFLVKFAAEMEFSANGLN